MKLLFVLIVSVLSISSAYSGLVNICLQNPMQLKKAKFKLREVLHPQDKVFLRESVGCLEISMPEQRMELYNSFLKQHFMLKNQTPIEQGLIGQSSPRVCHFQLIKESVTHQDIADVKLGAKTKLRKEQLRGNGKSVSSIMVNEGKWGMIRLNDTTSYVTCRKRGTSYDIEVSLSSTDTSVSTSLSVTQGQRINIGSIVQDLSHKDGSISLNKGYESHKSKGNENSNFYLVLK